MQDFSFDFGVVSVVVNRKLDPNWRQKKRSEWEKENSIGEGILSPFFNSPIFFYQHMCRFQSMRKFRKCFVEKNLLCLLHTPNPFLSFLIWTRIPRRAVSQGINSFFFQIGRLPYQIDSSTSLIGFFLRSPSVTQEKSTFIIHLVIAC